MSKKIQFKLNKKGVKQLMRSQEMMDICKGYADRALQRLGDGYESSTHVGRNRVNASVSAVWHQTKKENSANNTILKALR